MLLFIVANIIDKYATCNVDNQINGESEWVKPDCTTASLQAYYLKKLT